MGRLAVYEFEVKIKSVASEVHIDSSIAPFLTPSLLRSAIVHGLRFSDVALLGLRLPIKPFQQRIDIALDAMGREAAGPWAIEYLLGCSSTRSTSCVKS